MRFTAVLSTVVRQVGKQTMSWANSRRSFRLYSIYSKGEVGGARGLSNHDLYRVNFEVQQLKPFACLAFPFLHNVKKPQSSLVLVTNW